MTTSKGTDPLSVREATSDDREAVWQWWNDPVTRRMMKRNAYVPWEEHCAWFDRLLSDHNRMLCIGFLGANRFSAIRFDRRADNIYEVSINLNPTFRGMGLAPKVMEKSIEYFQAKKRIPKLFATLKKMNLPSKKTFSRTGFTFMDPPADVPGLEYFEPDNELYCERLFPSYLPLYRPIA